MANIIQIKHGSNEPTSENLTNYELGYSDTTEKLYINANGNIKKYGSDKISTTLTLTNNGGTIENISLTDNCSVFIDLDYTNSDLTDEQINILISQEFQALMLLRDNPNNKYIFREEN